jgi:hypothetical protein
MRMESRNTTRRECNGITKHNQKRMQWNHETQPEENVMRMESRNTIRRQCHAQPTLISNISGVDFFNSPIPIVNSSSPLHPLTVISPPSSHRHLPSILSPSSPLHPLIAEYHHHHRISRVLSITIIASLASSHASHRAHPNP